MAVAVEIDELEVWVAKIAVEARGEGAEGFPALGLVVFVKAGRGAFHHHHVELTVTGQVHQLGAGSQSDVGIEGDGFERREPGFDGFAAIRLLFRDRAEVALVEPSAGLLGEDARNALAVQVGPSVGAVIEADGQVVEALRVRHVIPGVRGVYDRYEYLAEKRDALERLARLVEKILDRQIGTRRSTISSPILR
jgi:hypothetical protein